MEILGRLISEKTTQHIQEIEASLHKPVIYEFTDPQKTQSYGQCDAWQNDAYYVYSKEALFNAARKKQINIPFETNLLHELSHLCQMEEGFPHTGTVHNATTAHDPDFFNSVGSVIASSILDLNVDFRLKEMGYTSEYFYQNRIIRAEKIFTRMKKGERLQAISFVTYACMLTCLNLVYQGPDLERVMNLCQEKVPGLYECVAYLSRNIGQIGFNDSFSAFKSLVFLFSGFNLWNTHTITYNGQGFNSLDAVLAFYPDIRTWEDPPHA